MLDITLVMIVKDEAQRIERCLASARPHVKHMVIVDTGSSDNTLEICRQFGADIHHYTWCNDFSAARNFALDQAPSTWRLVLDADEWLVACPLEAPPDLRDPFLGVIQRVDFFEAEGQSQSCVTWIPRLLPPNVGYAGPVHEQVVSDLPRKRLGIVIHHDGYLHDNKMAKQGRNKAILLDMLARQPDDPYVLYQLGVDEEIYGHFSSAADFYEKSCQQIDQAYAYKQVMVVRWMHCLTQSRQGGKALQLMEQHMDACCNCPDFFFTAGNVYLDLAMQDQAQAMLRWLPLAVASWERCLVIGERPDQEGAVAGRGSHLAAQNLYAVHSVMGHQDKAAFYARLAQRPH